MAKIKYTKTSTILEEAILLEKGIGELYKLFAGFYPEDEIFWKCLSNEEGKHANILEALRAWVAMGIDKKKILLTDILELKNKNIAIRKIIQKAKDEKPIRKIAYNLAYKIELTASEIHFQKKMTETTDDNKLLKAMQELCGFDKDHLKRIRRRMNSLEIKIENK